MTLGCQVEGVGDLWTAFVTVRDGQVWAAPRVKAEEPDMLGRQGLRRLKFHIPSSERCVCSWALLAKFGRG